MYPLLRRSILRGKKTFTVELKSPPLWTWYNSVSRFLFFYHTWMCVFKTHISPFALAPTSAIWCVTWLIVVVHSFGRGIVFPCWIQSQFTIPPTGGIHIFPGFFLLQTVLPWTFLEHVSCVHVQFRAFFFNWQNLINSPTVADLTWASVRCRVLLGTPWAQNALRVPLELVLIGAWCSFAVLPTPCLSHWSIGSGSQLWPVPRTIRFSGTLPDSCSLRSQAMTSLLIFLRKLRSSDGSSLHPLSQPSQRFHPKQWMRFANHRFFMEQMEVYVFKKFLRPYIGTWSY